MKRALVNELNDLRLGIVQNVRAADTGLFNLENGLSEILKEPGGLEKVLEIIKQSRKFLANVTD